MDKICQKLTWCTVVVDQQIFRRRRLTTGGESTRVQHVAPRLVVTRQQQRCPVLRVARLDVFLTVTRGAGNAALLPAVLEEHAVVRAADLRT